jgi:hypothetical protein
MPTATIRAATQAQDFTVLVLFTSQRGNTIASVNLRVPEGQTPEAFMQNVRGAYEDNFRRRQRFFNEPVVSIVMRSEASPIPYVTVSLPL